LLVEDYLPRKIKYPLFTFVEYSSFALLLFQQLRLKKLKATVIICSIAFFIFHFLYFLYAKRTKFDSLPTSIETLLIFIYIFFFFYEQLKEVNTTPIYSNYFFWVSIGLFFYLGGSFFIYLGTNSLSTPELIKYWFFTYIVETIKNILLVVAIFLYSKDPIKRLPKQAVPNLDFMI